MNTRHKQALKRQIYKLHSAASALERMIKKEDLKWAANEYEKEDATGVEADDVAMLLLGLSDSCKEMSTVFNY